MQSCIKSSFFSLLNVPHIFMASPVVSLTCTEDSGVGSQHQHLYLLKLIYNGWTLFWSTSVRRNEDDQRFFCRAHKIFIYQYAYNDTKC